VYILSPLNRVGTFTVKGNHMVSSNSVASASGIKMSSQISYLFVSKSAIEARVVNSSARIEKADLQISLPNKVQLHISEFKTIGYVQQKGKNYIILSNGLVIKDKVIEQSKISADSLLLTNFSDSQVKAFAKAYESFKPSLQSLIHAVTITPTQATKDFLTLAMGDGNTVKVPLSQMQEKLPFYPSVAKNLTAPETIDMEVGIFAAPTPQYNTAFSGDVPKSSSSSSASPSSSSSQ
jgi:cell division protein FtsQ